MEHKTSVRKSGKSTVASCKGCEWEVTFPGTDDATRAQAQRSAAVHAGESRRG